MFFPTVMFVIFPCKMSISIQSLQSPLKHTEQNPMLHTFCNAFKSVFASVSSSDVTVSKFADPQIYFVFLSWSRIPNNSPNNSLKRV